MGHWPGGVDQHRSAIYQLEVTTACAPATLAPGEEDWEVRVLKAWLARALPRYSPDPATPQLVVGAQPGTRFLVVYLFIRSRALPAVLKIEDVALVDGQGNRYAPVGSTITGLDYVFGELTGEIVMMSLDPPSLSRTFSVTGPGFSTEVEFPAVRESDTSPGLILVWQVPEEATGLQVVAPNALPADVDPVLEGE